MLSLATGKLVNRDQFRVMPMPESVIKRLNELALADGRVKGKGELAKPMSTYEQDSDVRDDLPETMETRINNGIDPSASLMDTNHNPELMYEEANEVSMNEPAAQQDEQNVEESGYVDDMVPAARVRFEPRVVEMNDLMSSFRELAVGQP